jgi:hypothetical protein
MTDDLTDLEVAVLCDAEAARAEQGAAQPIATNDATSCAS